MTGRRESLSWAAGIGKLAAMDRTTRWATLSAALLVTLACSGAPAPDPGETPDTADAPQSTAGGAPDTEIFVAPVSWDGDTPTLGGVDNVTYRDGYDNQPRFEADGSLLYTRDMGGQTDIWRLPAGARAGEAERVTDTPQSEYSPTPRTWAADGSFTVVRVEGDGSQRLWSFDRQGGSPELVVRDLEPVGYHAWAQDGGALVSFVLGEPARLVLSRPPQRRRAGWSHETVTADIGRGLVALDRDRVAFVQKGETWRIDLLDTRNGSVSPLIETRPEREDFTVDPRGALWMGDGARLYRFVPGRDGQWSEVADLSEVPGVGSITRLAFSADGSRLALVAERVADTATP
jgi:hypothetical protein